MKEPEPENGQIERMHQAFADYCERLIVEANKGTRDLTGAQINVLERYLTHNPLNSSSAADAIKRWLGSTEYPSRRDIQQELNN